VSALKEWLGQDRLRWYAGISCGACKRGGILDRVIAS
jgi:hypothetical protein